jgi:hypothetical protein
MDIMKTFKLENEPKIKSGFIIPESYFDHFSEKVMQQLTKEEPKVISIFLRKKSWLFVAAAIIGLGLIIPIYNDFSNHSSEIDEIILENYIANKSDISDTDLANLLDEEDIQKMSIDLDIEDKSIENELSINSNLEQYITN